MTTHDKTCSGIGELLSGYLDDELTQQDNQKVRIHLENCAPCRQLHRDLVAVKAQMQQLSYPKDDEALLQALEQDLLARTSAGIGWTLLLSGLAVVIGAGLYQFFTSPEVPGLVRFFYAVFMLGGLGLFFSVLRQRWLSWKTDKYKKVKL